MRTTHIKYYFDVLDKKYTDAIVSSAENLFDFYLPPGKPAKEKIRGDGNLAGFWIYLSNKTYGEMEKMEINMYILPLDRVGASQGASGSRVLVIYFSFNDPEVRYSNPLILKFQDLSITTRDKLGPEKEQADTLKTFTGDRTPYYAFPVFHDIVNKISILWAPFSSADFIDEPVTEDDKPFLKEDNLWKIFDNLNLGFNAPDDIKKIRETIKMVFAVLRPAHSKYNKKLRPIKNLETEYEWYLRDRKWLLEFSVIWGNASQKTVRDFDKDWINPIYVFDKLQKHEGNITIGCIHGDLHTKNIVFAQGSNVRIIDFGWTQDDRHVAKDFILLESNLRFMILHPDVPFSDLELLCQTIGDDWPDNPPYQCEYSHIIHELIADIRKTAKTLLDGNKMYEEYYIPLFYLSLGLLTFTKSFNNVTSARLTILHLAKNIDNYLNSLL